MSVSYDVFTGAFLAKVSEYEFMQLGEDNRTAVIDGFMKRALNGFRKNCLYDLFTTGDDVIREFNVTIPESDLDEISDIVAEGMVVQWLKPYVYKQENLQNAISTRDYSVFSPAELSHRVSEVYTQAKYDYRQMIREYSFNHGDLSTLRI